MFEVIPPEDWKWLQDEPHTPQEIKRWTRNCQGLAVGFVQDGKVTRYWSEGYYGGFTTAVSDCAAEYPYLFASVANAQKRIDRINREEFIDIDLGVPEDIEDQSLPGDGHWQPVWWTNDLFDIADISLFRVRQAERSNKMRNRFPGSPSQ